MLKVASENGDPMDIVEDSYWTNFWELLASTMRLTVGGLELMHAHNRANSQSTFATMAARGVHEQTAKLSCTL